ncbi:acyltransferase [Vagococcus salmoninarum]|uniref:acyltransferase n=1 Tax=Vagococcus salmoninarum TaxID=2739 RepID=UPI001880E208|nr:acyltransferase family protein [Vagococcus salmoninarum]MBE9390237.1 acyltransferase family protein [Vagococcus salmoninarum]
MRNHSVNTIKALACFSVIAVHFRRNLQGHIPKEDFGFYSQLFMAIIYALFIICVPLFLLTTGYLMNKKTPSKAYFIKILSIYSLYIICSLSSHVILSLTGHADLTFKEVFFKLSNFTLIGYSWYVEMYLGLALFIPYLNKLIKDISKREFSYVIAALLLFCGIPGMVNKIPFFAETIAFPKYWVALYPILYYFIGAYIKRFEDTFKSTSANLIIIALTYISSTFLIFTIAIRYASPYVGGVEGGYPSLIVMTAGTALFLLILTSIKVKIPLTAFIAKLTLPIYLMSYTIDQLVYPKLISYVSSPKRLFIFMPFIVGTIFIAAIILGFITDLLNRLFWRIIPRLQKRTAS